ncbi:MAG TPA: glycosyltransferase [Streptosporangiaceae bacterium]|jgi:glycosyltransferase involved in cell wall biosynthesis
MRVCVATIVHNPNDARILHRQIRALLDAGHAVTYVAPFRDGNTAPWPGIEVVDVPRARGRRRLRAVRTARRKLARHAPSADVVIVHDPELLLALPRRRDGRPVLVWDVHEDTAAALAGKRWLPAPLRPALRPVVRGVERVAERRMKLLLAEEGYRDRFRLPHPVVANTVYVPDEPPPRPGPDRLVYLGHISRARGIEEIVAAARMLRPRGVTVELIGAADAEVRPLLRDAQREGVLRWYGYVPNDAALRITEGALAGLAPLRDEPNYRHSLPTKIVEYMAHGVPVIATPLPTSEDIVTAADCGLIVPFNDPAALADAALRLRDDPELRIAMGKRGHLSAHTTYNWPTHAQTFVHTLEAWSAGR